MTSDEGGNATVLSMAFAFAITACGFLVLAQLQAVITTRAVEGAADLAAIAAAQSSGDACAQAERVAQANRVRLVDCTVQDADFVVRVESDLPSLVAAMVRLVHVQEAPIRATARAGVESGSDPGQWGDGHDIGLD